MGAKRFGSIYDWVRHGVNLHLSCQNGHCSHTGIVDPHLCWLWFRAHRWPDALEAGASNHFRCTRCGSKGAYFRATEQTPTVTNFFPVDDRGWKALERRLRG